MEDKSFEQKEKKIQEIIKGMQINTAELLLEKISKNLKFNSVVV